MSLDDTRFAPSGSRRLLIADTTNNVVYSLTCPFRANAAYSATNDSGTVGAPNLSSGAIMPWAARMACKKARRTGRSP